MESPASAPSELRSDAALEQIQAGARYFFKLPEFARLTGRPLEGSSAYLAVHRLAQRGRVVSVTRRQGGYLIVPPEHQSFGAPPVTWWLTDCLAESEPHHYVALLSAARHFGSAHYARQDVQVMVSRPRLALAPGRLRVNFTAKKNIERTPTVTVRTGVAPWRVSTRAATLLDLIRHQVSVGGLEAVARIAKDFAEALTQEDLVEALDALDQNSAAQRLGFIFDQLKLPNCARHVKRWLGARNEATGVQPLELGGTILKTMQTDSTWKVRFDRTRLSIFEELA